MIEINEENVGIYKKVNLIGRIDGLTSNEINKFITNLIELGNRNILLDFSGINYLSSVGLRILLVNQQKLKSVGGDLSIYGLTPQITDIFKMSGFLKIFTIISNIDELIKPIEEQNEVSKSSFDFELAKFEHINIGKEKSKVNLIGNFAKTETSEYSQTDLNVIEAKNTGLSIGFGAMGDDWEMLKMYFGESLTINNSLFYYPAVKKPAVDYMIYSPDFPDLKYGFLYNIQTNGKYNDFVSFESKNEPIEIQTLLGNIAETLKLDYYAFAIIAESKGIRGMNLKNIPINENKPTNNKPIFDNDNFANWVNFPVEAQDFNSIIAGAGFYLSKGKERSQKQLTIFGKESTFHLHSVIFDKSLIGFKVENFDEDFNKICNELAPTKVQHILTNSKFSIGNLAIIRLED